MASTFSVALSGMLSQGDRMSVIGNNIANSRTTAYKTSRLDFTEEFITQNGQFVNGTHNQQGNGVRNGGVTSDWSPGAAEATGNPANLAIAGDGFLAVEFEEQTYYTRAGDFALVNNPDEDQGGFVLMRPNGAVLLGGQGVDSTGAVTTPNGLGPIRFENMVTGDSAAPDSFEISPSGLVTAEPDRTWESVPNGYETINNLFDYQSWLTGYREDQELDLGKFNYYLPGYTGTSSWRDPVDTNQADVSVSAGLTGIGQSSFTGEVSVDGIVEVGFDTDGNFMVWDNDGAQTLLYDAGDSTAGTGLSNSEILVAYEAWEESYNINRGEYTPGAVVNWAGVDGADVTATAASGGQLLGMTAGVDSWEYPEDLYTGASGGSGLVVDTEKFHAWKKDYQAANGVDAYIPGVYEGTDGLNYLREWNPVRDFSFPMEVPEATSYTLPSPPDGIYNGVTVEPSYSQPTRSNIDGVLVRTYDAAGDYLGSQPADTETQYLLEFTGSTNENLEVNTFVERNWDPAADYEAASDNDTTNDPQDTVGVEDYIPPTDDNLVAGIRVINGQIPLVRFNNPDSLLREEAGLYRETTLTSVTAGLIEPSKNGSGTLLQGSLEGSNVDLTVEFTEMIQTQRAFQANGKTITTADEMLQTVMGLKR